MEVPISAILDCRSKCEQKAEEFICKIIEEDWLRHNEFTHTYMQSWKMSIYNSDGEEIRDNSSDDEKDLEDSETPQKVEETLRGLRNFSFDMEPLDTRLYEVLKPGNVLLSWHKVAASFDWYSVSEKFRNGKGFLCLLHGKESTASLCHISTEEEGFTIPIECYFGENAWFNRQGRNVLVKLCDGYPLKLFQFETALHASKLEFDLFMTGIFNRFPILRLRGSMPTEQLLIKGLLKVSEDEICMIEEFKNLKENVPVKGQKERIPAIDQEDYVKSFRKKAEAFVTYVQRVLALLVKWSSKVSPSEEMKSLIFSVRKDTQTISRMIPFFHEDDFSKSLCALSKHMRYIDYTIYCCQLMIKCSDKYDNYFHQVERISKKALGLLNECVSQSEQSVKFVDDDLHKAVAELKQMLISSKEQLPTPTPEVDSIEVVCSYLTNQQSSPGFPKLFDKLDQQLRFGNESVFDVICRDFKKEMFESLLPLKRVKSIGHRFVGERMLSNRPSWKKSEVMSPIRLDELRPPQNYNDDFFEILAEDEYLVVRKVTETILVFENILLFVEYSLGFKMELWMKLWNLRNIASDVPQSMSFEDDEKDAQNDVVLVEVESDAEDFFEVMRWDDEFENIFTFPRTWDTYRKFAESDFQPMKAIGKGEFGEAWLVHHHKLRRMVCKRFFGDIEDRTKEMEMIVKLQGNTNIVRLYGFYYTSKQYFDCLPTGIVMEYVELSLYKFIHDGNEISFNFNYILQTALEYVKDMASGFSAMHTLGVYHRDIKPENILLTYEKRIRICDFGTCGDIKTLKTGQFGTHRYESPEMLNILGNENYNEKTDVYSLAVTVWELIHRRLPYTKFNNGQISAYVYKGGRPKIKDSICPEGLKDIIQRAWAQKASDRPTMSEIQHSISSLLLTLPEEVLEEKLSGPSRGILPDDQ